LLLLLTFGEAFAEVFTHLGFQALRDLEALTVAIGIAINVEDNAIAAPVIVDNPIEKLAAVDINLAAIGARTGKSFLARNGVAGQIEH